MTTKEELQDLFRQIDLKIDEMTNIKDDYSNIIGKLRNKVRDCQEHLENINEQYGRWKPKEGEIYWYITSNGVIYIADTYIDDIVDKDRYSLGNVYQTKKQAEQALERLKIRTQLEDIALRLNKGQKITFGLDEEYKYYLQFAFGYSEINQGKTRYLKSQDVIYCLDLNFKDVAIAEIGEDRLAKYLRGEYQWKIKK